MGGWKRVRSDDSAFAGQRGGISRQRLLLGWKDMTKKRIGVHVGTSGGCWTAVERAVNAGANTMQIFSSSARQWKASPVKPEDAVKMSEARAANHTNQVSNH